MRALSTGSTMCLANYTNGNSPSHVPSPETNSVAIVGTSLLSDLEPMPDSNPLNISLRSAMPSVATLLPIQRVHPSHPANKSILIE